MTRIDTLRAISAICRGSHTQALLAVGLLTVEMPREALEELLAELQEMAAVPELVGHLDLFKRLYEERWNGSSRLG